MNPSTYFIRQIRWGLLGLMLVALYGTLMRYKIAFDFPFFNQKNLLHAHSHFAFTGWVSHLLYSGLLFTLSSHLQSTRIGLYRRFINLNLISAFGMLISFTVWGYHPVSIAFSTLSIVVAIFYLVTYIKDVKTLSINLPALLWARTGLLLNVLSALGPFCLAYMMMSKNIHHDWYLAAVYFYLHFQYSGWFFFGAMSLGLSLLPASHFGYKKYFTVFAITSVPTYVLSVLWAQPPLWLYIITVIATLAQLVAWILLCRDYFKNRPARIIPVTLGAFLLYAAALAMTLKFILQAVSVIPSLSQLVFGFRPIVIAYLHLVLLGVFSLFLLGYLIQCKGLLLNRGARWAIIGFFTGVLLNESFLGIQGIAAFTYTLVPFINELLLIAALILFTSSTVLLFAHWRRG